MRRGELELFSLNFRTIVTLPPRSVSDISLADECHQHAPGDLSSNQPEQIKLRILIPLLVAFGLV